MKKLFLFLLINLFVVSIHSQNSKLEGIVIDSKSNPIIGATVKLLNSTVGVVTDLDGKFSLSVPQKGELQISFVGYKAQTFSLNKLPAGEILKVVLVEDTEMLDELVVVGYAVQKKATLTGSVSVVGNEKLTTTPNENIVNMMSGKLPGIRIRQYNGEPGAFASSFDIRGLGEPLIVINGVPSENADFQRLNANDIESISVLKDAAAAIYGVKAANGVVLVTTKKGTSATEGKVDISYSINQGWQFFQRVPEPCGVFDYMMLKNELKQRQESYSHLGEPMPTPEFTEENINMYRTGELIGTNWSDGVLKNLAPQTQHNLSMNGSTGKIDYYFNLGYLKQGGLFKTNDIRYERWNFRSNAVVRIVKGLKAEINLSGYIDEKHRTLSDVNEIYKMVWMLQPTVPAYANNNPLYPGVTDDNKNPLIISYADKAGYNNNYNKAFQGQLALEYDFSFIKGLKARIMYNYNLKHSEYKRMAKQFSMYTYNPEKQEYLPHLSEERSSYSHDYSPTSNTLLQTQLSYNNTFEDKHNVAATLVYEEMSNYWDNLNAKRFLELPIYELFTGVDNGQIGKSNGRGEDAKKSFIGRFAYDYASKYLVDFAFRYDGSSKFSSDSRWGFFPSASVGWRISEENFMKESSFLSFINNLKVRASYGVMGDDSALSYQYLSGYSYPNRDAGFIFNDIFYNGLKSRGVANPNLTWFKAKTFNVGIDANAWNGLLGASFDYFVRDRDGLLATRSTTIPGTVGVELPQENLNSDRAAGWELTLTHHNEISDFKYDVSVNISSTRTRNKHVESQPFGNSYEYWRNSTANRYTDVWWGKLYGGQFTSYDQIMNHPIRNSAVPGDFYYEDWNNDGKVDDLDIVPIGIKNLPLINYGINLSASWKNFDIDLVFQGSARYYTQFDSFYATPAMWGRNSLDKFLDRWHTKVPNTNMYDPTTEWVAGYYPTTGSPEPEGGESTRGIKNASYLRLKSAELGYTLPKKYLKAVHIQNLRVYLSGYNLFTITGLRDADPEHPSAKAQGDYQTGAYPINSSFNIGANITF